jgi:hypothetical protein
MKNITLYTLLLLPILVLSQSKKKPNIINYFASNNQIIGVPMVDLDNEFRFYPDLSFQEAIMGIEVYYFVMNDVFKHHLVKREDGRYWAATLRDFSLGEAIQRVEVIVDCKESNLNFLLNKFGIQITKENNVDRFHYYLLLRRGDEKNLYRLKYYNTLKDARFSAFNEVREEFKKIIKTEDKINEQMGKISTDLSTDINKNLSKIDDFLIKDDLPNLKILKNLSNNKIDEISDSLAIKQVIRGAQDEIKSIENKIDLTKSSQLQTAIKNTPNYKPYQENLAQFYSQIRMYQNDFQNLRIKDTELPSELFKDTGSEVVKNLSGYSDENSRLYSAYVENRLSSMLDMRYKSADTTIIQFNYRNDKQSLQYLQAGDPQEKLGIFRARLVPFPFYRQEVKDDKGNINDDFKWQRGKVIYEIGINFGYAIVKDDHFTPKFFDMNRLGLGIGISADTFSNNPTFLSVSLTYDMNTYTSLSFGANLVDKPGFYMGVGINARAFKDLVKNSGALFK